jgi:hypothetical protein
METERLPIDSLREDPANARMHSQHNLDAIKGSLDRFGQQKPIVVDEDNVVRAGNGTLLAAQALGWEEISVVRSNLVGPEMTAYAIADNRTAELGEWNRVALAQTLEHLGEHEAASSTGFTPSEVKRALLRLPDRHEDDAPDLGTVEAITERGEVWALGDHLIMCGDAENAEDWQKLMGDQAGGMAFADPPYDLYDTNFVRHLETHTTNAHVFVMCDDKQMQTVLRASSMNCERFFVMDIGFCIPHAFDAFIQHILVARLANGKPQQMTITGDGFRSIRRMAYRGRLHEQEREGHPHQKPVEAVAAFISHYSRPGEIVLDPFLGSGTTLVAAEQTGRKCYGMELDPSYCDIAIRRWENFTEQSAERVEDRVRDRTTESPQEMKP